VIGRGVLDEHLHEGTMSEAVEEGVCCSVRDVVMYVDQHLVARNALYRHDQEGVDGEVVAGGVVHAVL
jgi:hypothetical protein